MSQLRRWIAEYLILVGVPVIGITAVIFAGRHLTAAAPIDGSWALAWTGDPGLEHCGLPHGGHIALRLAQSGRYITGSMRAPGSTRRIALEGTLDGENLQLTGTDACGGSLAISAAVGGVPTPNALRGSVIVGGCGRCGTAVVTGSRRAEDRTLIPEEGD